MRNFPLNCISIAENQLNYFHPNRESSCASQKYISLHTTTILWWLNFNTWGTVKIVSRVLLTITINIRCHSIDYKTCTKQGHLSVNTTSCYIIFNWTSDICCFWILRAWCMLPFLIITMKNLNLFLCTHGFGVLYIKGKVINFVLK